VVLCSWIYSGALVIVNRAVDSSPPSTYRAVVLAKWIGRGRGGGPTLELGPWGPRAERETTLVSRDTYERARIGGSVRVLLRPGWLGMAWFTVE
jgi:hypothetical protein